MRSLSGLPIEHGFGIVCERAFVGRRSLNLSHPLSRLRGRGGKDPPVEAKVRDKEVLRVALRSADLKGQGLRGPLGAGEAAVLAFPPAQGRSRVRSRRVARARRRLALAVTGILLVGLFIIGEGPQAQAPASVPGTPRAVVIGSGDTLWELAERYAPPSVDPRAYVEAIEDLNGLAGPPGVGVRLRLPR